MSSNTLRGIGQEGDGDGGDRPKPDAPDAGSQPGAPGQSDADPKAEGTAAGVSERMPELRKIRSLDSTVPGTRSLDSSVPEASPSLDGKVPSMAATMLGMTAPSVPGRDATGRAASREVEAGRDKGTVQGRDVHLPPEMQRRAGMLPVAGASPAARPQATSPLGPPEPTVAEPVRVDHGHPDLKSHGPWYEQEPLSADTYDDPKPSLIGRVAIAAAIAASLAVVLFAIVRVRAQGQAQEAEAAQQMPTLRSPASVTPPAAAPPAEPAAAGTASAPPPAADDPTLPTGVAGFDNAIGAAPPSTAPAPVAPRPSSAIMLAPNRPGSPPMPYQSRPFAAAKPAPVAPLPNNLFRPKALGEAPSDGTPPQPTASGMTPPPVAGVQATTPPAAVAPSTPPAASAPASAASDESPAAETPAVSKPAASKPKGKTYDPDSTLPLNLD